MSLDRLAGRLGRRPDLLALVLLGLLAAVPRLSLLARAPAFITNDSLSYLLPGFDLATGLGFDPLFKRPPGYSALIAASLWFFGQQDLLGLLAVQHVLGVLTVWLVYGLGSTLFNRSVGWLAGLLTAISGPLMVTEHYLMSETLFGCLLAASLLLAVIALRGRRLAWLALAGLTLGLATLTRPAAQMVLPVLALLSLLSWPRPRAAILAAMLLVGSYGLVVLPWMARNSTVQGSFTVAGGLGEGLAVRTIRLGQEFDFRAPPGGELRIYREEARQESVYELARRLRTEAGLTPAEADRAMRDIALSAILQKPSYYLLGSLDMFAQMFAGRQVRLRQDWQPWRGIQWEERVGHLFPAPALAQDRQFNQAQALVSIYDPARWSLLVGPLFVLGCLSLFPRPDRWVALLIPGVALGLLLASAFLVGIEWRYRFPLDPLINVTVASGALTVINTATAKLRTPHAAIVQKPVATD